MSAVLAKFYRFLAKNWNALLAATSMIGVAIFSLIPPLSTYLKVFIFVAANAAVWTLIEIKADLTKKEHTEVVFSNMRLARRRILHVIFEHIRRSRHDRRLAITLIGGRIRSMSDIVREIADEMRSGRVTGFVDVRLFCLDPRYLADRLVPGPLPDDQQKRRNTSYATLIESVRSELESLPESAGLENSIHINVVYYSEDPQRYAFLVGDNTLFWGPYTWSLQASDFLGPENPCFELNSSAPSFIPIRDWLMTRTALYELEYVEALTRSRSSGVA